ncbi:hypothetical protein ACGE0T_10140 [Parabacteroides sp. APC149_11_2_Y6]
MAEIWNKSLHRNRSTKVSFVNLHPSLRSIIAPAMMRGMNTPNPPQINQKRIGSNPVISERNGMHR